jgi:Tat protein secretion system quality control protein TatD with DNase activity
MYSGSRSTWWGVLVFCDPKSWPKDPEKLNLPERWVAAVGVHPKHASDFGDYYFDRLSRLMDSPAVTALGEVGMDCSEGANPFAMQKSTLRWVMALAHPYMPLVLHVRIIIAKVTGMLRMYSHCCNPSLGEIQLFWVLRPRFGVAEDQHPPQS